MKKLMAAMLSFVMAMMLLAGCASASTDNTFSDPMQQVSLSNDEMLTSLNNATAALQENINKTDDSAKVELVVADDGSCSVYASDSNTERQELCKADSVQQGDLPQEENTMKRLFAGTLALVMTCGLLFSGCGKQMTPEEEAASQEAAISQQLQDEENKTGLKRLISNNLTEYEQPVHDFIEGLQDGDAEKTAMALGVPNTFEEKLQDWVVVNDFETFQKTDMTNICLNSAKEGSKAAINVFMKTPGEVTADTSPDYTLTAEYTNGAWVLNPPTGILTDYSFTVPNNKVSFQETDLSNYTAKNAETGVWTVTLPRVLDLDSDAAYVISTDMGDFNGRVYQIAADGNKKQMLLADIDSDTRDAYQSKLSAVMKEVYRLLSIGAGESDFSNVLLDSNEISNCVPEPVDSDDDVEAIQANADKKALGASVTSITVTPDDTIEGYPDAYTYRLDGNDGVKMNVKLKVSTTNGDAHMKATIGMRIINGAWKIVSIDSKRDIFTGLSVLDPEW